MAAVFGYAEKFESFRAYTLYGKLTPAQQEEVRRLAFAHAFTFQEFRQVVEACRDLAMWGEGSLADWWQAQQAHLTRSGAALKQEMLRRLQDHLLTLQRTPARYQDPPRFRPRKREKTTMVVETSDKKIHGMCPVASPRTVCCNLRTIDAVENCIFGCSYCTIQTFYRDQYVFDRDFARKLAEIPLDPERFYHFGTGQSSDALVWGNRNGILDALCNFAAAHPNVLLEFKTKSHNVRYFLSRTVPENIVCSWSLNTPTIITNEEHFTAGLEQRLAAARQVADRGLKVAFHFHPLVHHEGWQTAYPALAGRVLATFSPEEVLFLSLGSVTLIKPALKKIRELGHPTRIYQFELVPDPHGKLTYPDEIKLALFRNMYAAFAPWHGKVFIYLCMEKASLWQETFGFVYPDNETFEREFGRATMAKLGRGKRGAERARTETQPDPAGSSRGHEHKTSSQLMDEPN